MTIDNSQYTVLVVDDVPVNILLVKGMLAKQKFKVLSATSGQQALEVLTHEHPDCILLDILMPNMNGFETTRAIRANPKTQDIPIILLSALNSDSDIKRCTSLSNSGTSGISSIITSVPTSLSESIS